MIEVEAQESTPVYKRDKERIDERDLMVYMSK